MKAHPVVFITVLDYDNLGVGYMASLLSGNGFHTRILDFNMKKPKLLKIIRKLDPLLIGFSVIFHNYIERFARLIDYLRINGITCHITAGGHYATLQYEKLLLQVPGLDSIVRFEGESPIVELAGCLSRGEEWEGVINLAFRNENSIHKNAALPLEKDLDIFPLPMRYFFREYAFGRTFTTILAGRGCVYNCTFCNTREFYKQAGGPVKRIRRPEAVVSEMEWLYKKKRCSVFIFQDDDFPVKVAGKTDWIQSFCTELTRKKLTGKVLWKINCRPDEIDEENFSLMKKHGLFLVFLGIEDGTDTGLKRLNKKMPVSASLKGIDTLKSLEIGFDYGFMLFLPSTTFRSLLENIDFLKQFCEDGYTPATFLKLVPFYNTKAAADLEKEGRLKISEYGMDYDFIEEQMTECYNFITECFNDWREKPDGFENISKWARNYFNVWLHFDDGQPEAAALLKELRTIISEANIFMLDTIRAITLIFESMQNMNKMIPFHESFRGIVKGNHLWYRAKINNTVAELLNFNEIRQTAGKSYQ
jgi:radical SAM superfamily enzyme YgiQ (UPF0313 family)